MDIKHGQDDAPIVHMMREASILQGRELKVEFFQKGEKLELMVECQFCYSDCNIHDDT